VEQISGEVYIIAGNEPVTIEELTTAIAESLNVSSPRFHLPLALGKLAGASLQFVYNPLNRQPPFSERSLDFFLKNNAYDISKARQELGFDPQIDLRTGLEQTLRF
jgi:nucleoside-diphosphate-sugar epimerase